MHPISQSTRSRFSPEAGRALRRARRQAELTLRDVMERSRGRFKPSVLGAYERGERSISLDRFVELAELYRIPADRLLAEALTNSAPAGRHEVVLHVSRLTFVTGEEGRIVAEMVHRVKLQRGDYMAEVVTLRSGDLEALSLVTNRTPTELLRILQPAVHGNDRTHGPK